MDYSQHEISMAADEGVRQLIELSEVDVSPAQKTAAMKSAVEKRCFALRQKMGKLVAVANPNLTDGWFDEVRCIPSIQLFIRLVILKFILRYLLCPFLMRTLVIL